MSLEGRRRGRDAVFAGVVCKNDHGYLAAEGVVDLPRVIPTSDADSQIWSGEQTARCQSRAQACPVDATLDVARLGQYLRAEQGSHPIEAHLSARQKHAEQDERGSAGDDAAETR